MADIHIHMGKSQPAAVPMPPPYIGPPQTMAVQQIAHEMPVSKPGAPQLQVVQPGAPHLQVVQPGAPHLQVVQPGAPQVQVVQPGAPQVQVVQSGAPQVQVVQPGAPQFQVMQPDAPQFQVMQPGAPQFHVMQPGAPQFQVVPPVTVAPQTPIKDRPMVMTCPHCRTTGLTLTEYRNGNLTWIIFAVLFVLLLWPFSLIPFCVKSCKDVKHSCGTCGTPIHVYKRI
uniref:lipopolysaccharide-induced tumor necrosis factor-alpha factor homolog n=1 Tax=Doryrhamphus excisus TaxID=161450 RepID=UPI0025AE93F8|nr:lipopolysaccharide-induced tumor necrosis factor-alpha factor homolog [Doryrhamphus excisus]